MEITIKQESELTYRAYDVAENLIGSCSYIADADLFYNSIEGSWNANPTDLYEWLLKSMNKKYGSGFKVRFTSDGFVHDEVQYAKQRGGLVDPNNIQIPDEHFLFPITWEWDDGGCGWNIYWRKYNRELTPNKDALIGHVSIDKKHFSVSIDWLEFGDIIFDPNEIGNEFDSVRLFNLVSNCMKDCALHKEKYNKYYEEPVDWYELNDKGYFDEN